MNNNFFKVRNVLFITYQPVLIIMYALHIIDNLNLFINNIENIFRVKLSSKKVSLHSNYFAQPTLYNNSPNLLYHASIWFVKRVKIRMK